jgi:hypothetical protein
VYHYYALFVIERGNNFSLKEFCIIPGGASDEHNLSNFFKWSWGSSLLASEKGQFQTMAIRLGLSSLMGVEVDGSVNSLDGVERS